MSSPHSSSVRRSLITRPIEWQPEDLAVPAFTGPRAVEESIAELREYIDWTYFFHAWELKGRYPAILEDPEKGEVARDLFAEANELLASYFLDRGQFSVASQHFERLLAVRESRAKPSELTLYKAAVAHRRADGRHMRRG